MLTAGNRLSCSLTESSKRCWIAQGRCRCRHISPSGWRIVTVEDVAFLGTACDAADLVVAPFALRLDACRSGARLVTARHLRRTGAMEIEPAGDKAVSTLSEAHITPAVETVNRPWSRHRTYDWRSGAFETEKDGQAHGP